MMTDTQLDTLLKCSLFKNISKQELLSLLPCLNATLQSFDEHQLIFNQGNVLNYVYIVIEGEIEIAKTNFAGQKNIISLLNCSQLFGEGVVSTTKRLSPVSATALSKAKLLLIPYERITIGCKNGCSFHFSLIHNMMNLLAEKNYHLNNKMDIILLKSMREKLLSYLTFEAQRTNSKSFTLPFNRNQLADYLNVSRPSMCRELARMKEEGLIDYYQNSFKLLDPSLFHNS